MPELPEVETITRRYRRRLEGRRIVGFTSRWAKQAQPSVAAVRRGIVGRRITRLWRRAKFIVADLDGGGKETTGEAAHLLIHLRMSGRFEWAAEHEDEQPHVRAIFELDNGNALWFCDPRKFGKIIFTTDLEAATEHLGIEPLGRGFTAEALEIILSGRSRQLKPLLLDQSLVAGLGNIYVDESLFQAGLHPTLLSDRLSGEQVGRLRNEIQAVLRKAIKHNGTSFDSAYRGGGMLDYLKVYGRGGEPCKLCGMPIEVMRIAQRGTHVCPKCQPLGRKKTNRQGRRRVS